MLVLAALAGGGLYWRLGTRGSTETAGGATANPANRKLRVAPDFALKDSTGREHKLGEFRGNTVLVHYWASWCPPCLEEIPQVLESARATEGRSLRWILISEDDNWADALKVLPNEKLASNMISVLDPGAKVAEAYGSFQFPETYLVSPELRIWTKLIGPQPWNGEPMRKLIENALTKPRSQ